MKNEELIIKVNRKQVFRESTEDLNQLKAIHFATHDEYLNTEYIRTSNIDVVDEVGYMYGPESIEIEIGELKKMIEKVEASGANFISIDFHGDHNEYDVYGFLIERTTPEELEAVANAKAEREKSRKAARIANLEKRLKQLKEEDKTH